MVVIPEKEALSPNFLKVSLAQQQKQLEEGQMLNKVCQKYKVPLLDLSGVFLTKNLSLLYYEQDKHLRPYGHELTAALLEEFIRENKLLN